VDRRGRILVDTGRNDYSATLAAAYTVRARPGAPVSAPCTWEEVERGEVAPRSFTIRNMAKRIENVGDLWADMLKTKRSLRLPIERLDKMLWGVSSQACSENSGTGFGTKPLQREARH
jgi:bifunctional non-homologous end joining protein LigD